MTNVKRFDDPYAYGGYGNSGAVWSLTAPSSNENSHHGYTSGMGNKNYQKIIK
jgi:hypothetical protein